MEGLAVPNHWFVSGFRGAVVECEFRRSGVDSAQDEHAGSETGAPPEDSISGGQM